MDEQIRLLCNKAATAEDSEVPAIFSELQAALHEHAQLVGEMAKKTLRWKKKHTSSSNAADSEVPMKQKELRGNLEKIIKPVGSVEPETNRSRE